MFYATARHGAANVVRLHEPEEILSHINEKPGAFLLVDTRFADRVLDHLPSTHTVLETTAGMPGGKSLVLIGPARQLANDHQPYHQATAHRGPPIRPL